MLARKFEGGAMRPGQSRLWISVALLVACAGFASADDSKAAARPAAGRSVVQTKESQAAMTPARALDALKAGNKRFRAGTSVQKNRLAKVKASAAGQYPFAVVLSCMDSRVPVEEVCDQSIGDRFSIRVAGNVVNVDNLGSLEYAAKVIGVKLIVVLGHTSCGAIKGAIDNVKLGNLTELVGKIRPAVEASGPGTAKDYAYVDKVGEQNVRLAMKEIRDKSPVLKEMLDSGSVGLVGGMYNLETGAVTFFAD
jgi:carbonic anhydrase